MNIVMLAAEFPPEMWGGLTNYSYNIAKYLSAKNQVEVNVFPHMQSLMKYASNLEFVVKIGRKVQQKKARNEVDIVYAITFQPHFSGIGFAAKQLHLPFVSHGVGADVYTSNPLYVFARKTAYKISDRIICGSNFQRRIMVKEGASNEKVSVVLGGVDCETFRPFAERDEFRKALGVEDKFVLLALGRFDKRKGFDDAIKALTYLKDIDDVVLLIVGMGSERTYLEELTKSLALMNKVRFLGFVSSDSLIKIYNAADLFVAPFKSLGRDMEGFPLVVQEAQACGVPVVSTFSAGVPELIEDNSSGFLVPESSPQSLAQKIHELYENEKLRKRMGQNARKRAEALLDWAITVSKIENLFREAYIS